MSEGSERSDRTVGASSEGGERTVDPSAEHAERDVEQGNRPEAPLADPERTAMVDDAVLADDEHGATVDHGRSTQDDDPDGTRSPGVPNSGPPWQRGVTGSGRNGTSGIQVSQPQHAARSGPAWGVAPRAEPGPKDTAERTYGFSAEPPGSAEAPTESVRPVGEASPQGAFDQATVRTEQPVFQRATPRTQQPAAEYIPPSSRMQRSRAPRRASLMLQHLDPWSVLKLSLVLNVAGFLAWMVAVGILYGVLDGMGVWDQLNGTYSDLTSVSDPQGGELISGGRVFGVAALIGAVNIVLFTAMATVGTFIYNASSDLAGGIELTLSERD